MPKLLAKSTRTFLITAGPTVEDIDPVRFISNRATGKLGVAMAAAALSAGHRVILIHGPISTERLAPLARFSKPRLEIVAVRSADQMHKAVMKHVKRADVVIMNAAVADFAPLQNSKMKLKKAESGLILRLKPTVDILKALGKLKQKRPSLKLIGFALETGRGRTPSQRAAAQLSEAQRKLRDKNLDAIVLDTPHAMGANASDFTVIERSRATKILRNRTKDAFAKFVINKL